jgi:poly-gamma-glutamate capsule biosynthesis protein CapA/YwtB (metallophosphatase superfamily)
VPPPAAAVVEHVATQAPQPDFAALRLTVAATGDIMLGTDYPETRLAPDDGVGYLAAPTPLLQSADVAFGNLEGVLLDGGVPEKACTNPAACYLFRSPPRYAGLLAAAGFDVMSLANNHARDFGEAGRDASMAALAAAGIRQSGREGEIASWEQNGLRIALIAFSPTRESWQLLTIDAAAEAVAALAAAHEIVIVSFHGGAEGQPGAERLGFGMEYAYGEQRGDLVAFAHAVIDAGADLVLGHGPHVPRALELYNERLIAYSLGNFATYYGISVAGAKGYAPLLWAELDGLGRFQGGRVHSFIQRRPDGPQRDPQNRALAMMRELTRLDFPAGRLQIGADGTLAALP